MRASVDRESVIVNNRPLCAMIGDRPVSDGRRAHASGYDAPKVGLEHEAMRGELLSREILQIRSQVGYARDSGLPVTAVPQRLLQADGPQRQESFAGQPCVVSGKSREPRKNRTTDTIRKC